MRKTRSDCTVGTFEKKHGLPPGTIRNRNGRDTRSDKKIETIRKEALKLGGNSMNGLQLYLDKMVSIFNKRSEDFTYTNYEEVQMPIHDYMDESIPEKRVVLDTEKMIAILREAKRNLSVDDFLILIAAYCNYYIEEGIMFRINQDHWGLNEFFSTKDDKDIPYLVCDGVVRQDYSCFDKILELDKNCTVANVYLFVKCMAEVTYLISINDESVDKIEKKAWNYYEQLSQTWKQYVIQEKEEYPYIDKSPIPYIFCGKRETSHMEDMLIDYTKSILEKLDIQEFEPRELYNLIEEKYSGGITHTLCKCLGNFNVTINDESITHKLDEWCDEVKKIYMIVGKAWMRGTEKRKKTRMDMIFLFEKLGYLVQMTNQDRKNEHRFKILPFPKKENALLYRYAYVHIPVVTCESISMRQLVDRYRLFSINCALENKLEVITQMNIQRAKMVNQLEHSWGNESYPEIVKDVAESLNKQNKNDLANKLFMAYESENMMMGQIIILQALMSEDPGELKRTFQDSFFESGEKKIGYKIDEIFDGNLNRLISNLIYSKEHSTKKKTGCREKLSVKHSIEDIKKKYSDFQTNDNENSIFDWFNDNIFDMKFVVDEEWKKVNFGLTQNGRIIFENILMELFTNVLFHGKDYCNIRLFSEDEKYKIEIRNGIDYEKHGSQKGLETMGVLIDKLNFETNVLEKEGLVYQTIDDNCFVTTISLAKELMYLEGWVL